ncbi:MAG: hypothetical protein LBK13_11535 [Spirochaetales bacterium]|jgi:energy-coupling factor transporter transmembrane protein EcfT|nr:hypothetical protein [Spirochaetales bacterium]
MSNQAKSPLSALTDTAGQGLKIVILALVLIFLFLIPNLVCIGFGVAALFQVTITRWVIVFFVLLILAAAGACAAAFFFTYEYFLIDTIRVIYAYLVPVFRSLCATIAKRITEGNTGIIKKGYDWSENITDSFQNAYNRKVPRLIRTAIRFILEQFPFADIMYHVSIDTKTQDTEALGNSIYTQFDAYLHTRFFNENSMKWILWFLPINIGIQILLIWLMH